MTQYAAGHVASATAPTNPDVNDVWIDLTTNVIKTWNGTAWAVGAGVILASHVYNPGSDVIFSTTSATDADVSTANATVTFTAPASGSVWVSAQFYATTGAGVPQNVSLRESAATISGTSKRTAYDGQSTLQLQSHPRWYITGLTPGSVHTYTLGFSNPNGSGTCEIHAGTLGGALTMMVQAA